MKQTSTISEWSPACRLAGWLSLAGALLLLGGCAAYRAHQQGLDLLEEGRVTEALPFMKQAARLEPGSVTYRADYLQARESALQRFRTLAQTALREGDLEEATRHVQAALAVEPADGTAQGLLSAIDKGRRVNAWMTEAQQAREAKDFGRANVALRMVLTEDPQNTKAKGMLSDMAERAARPMPSAERKLGKAFVQPISIEFKDASLRQVFDALSKTASMNFVFDKEVKLDQKTSIFLRKSTLDAAVGLIALTNQLDHRVLNENTVLIFPNTPTKQREYQPLVVRTFYLANADVQSVAATLKAILKSKDVVTDSKLNMLVLRDSPEAVRMAERLITLHDVPESEVMLEVEVLEVKRSRLTDLGVRWPDQVSLTPLAASGGGLTLEQLKGLNERTIGAAVGNTTVTLRKQDNDTNLLANPRIRARNKEKARILIGDKVPVITTTATATGFLSESITYVDVGLKLDVEPVVGVDKEVEIKVSLEVSNIASQVQTKSGSLAYQIGTRVAQTVLKLKDGENQVLAGLISDEDRKSAYKVPLLGDIPLVGRLFGSQASDGSKTEIVLSITPRVIRAFNRPAIEDLEFDSGTESTLSFKMPPHSVQAYDTQGPAMGQAATVVSVTGTVEKPVAGAEAQVTDPSGKSEHVAFYWQAPKAVNVAQKFSVLLGADTLQALQEMPFSVQFDSKRLKLVGADNALNPAHGLVKVARTDEETGKLLLQFSGPPSGLLGPATLSGLRFEALAPGRTTISVNEARPAGVAGKALTVALPEAIVLEVLP